MTIRTEFPYQVETLDPVWIPLSDGTRIAATIWRPVTQEKVPAVVEMIPYRRRDGTVWRDFDIQPYIAGYGIATVRIDIRGAGDSGGQLLDEYLPQEQKDAVEIIDWVAGQSWCTGKIGMWGISWGGFNSLQVAARRPAPLKAIIALCCSDDRYADDVHYMGGCYITEDPMWGAFMLAKKALAPDPQIVGESWREIWHERLRSNECWSENWLSHQRRDAYWKQGSVCEDYSAITAAVYAIVGWEDSYSNFVPRLLQGLKGPRKGLIGPWSHAFPCRGAPGPNIGYLQEALRWWRYWLKGEETGIMDEPMLRAWMLEPDEPKPYYWTHPGRWVVEPSWPSPNSTPLQFHLTGHGLSRTADGEGVKSVRSPATAGIDCGRWGGYGDDCPDMAIDQRREDGQALCFDTEVLEEDIEILGAPVVKLRLSSDRQQANLAVRLCDVDPDGVSALVTYGVLNLSHRDSHEHPKPLNPGEWYDVTLALNDIGRRFPKGHRIRLAIASQHWPIIWPSPELVRLSVQTERSVLELPYRRPRPEDAALPPFGPAEMAPPVPNTELQPGVNRRTVTTDVGSGVTSITLLSDAGVNRLDDRNITTFYSAMDHFEIRPDDPLSARCISEHQYRNQSADADVATKGRVELTATATDFLLSWSLEVKERGQVVHSAGRTKRIPRDHL